MKLMFSLIKKAQDQADIPLVYDKRGGAICPWCRSRAPVVESVRIKGGVKIRYHRCRNTGKCLIASMGLMMKSEQQIDIK